MKKSFLCVAIVSFLAIGGCGSSSTTSLSNSQESEIVTVESEKLYQKNCAGCHGGYLQGGIGPSLQQIGSRLTKEQIFKQIQNGGKTMPAQSQLPIDQQEQLSIWLAEKK